MRPPPEPPPFPYPPLSRSGPIAAPRPAPAPPVPPRQSTGTSYRRTRRVPNTCAPPKPPRRLLHQDLKAAAMSPAPSYARIAFVASGHAEAQAALAKLTASYGNAAPETADAIVALGGDGFML